MSEKTLDQLVARAVELKCSIAIQQNTLKEVQKEIEAMCVFPEGKNTAHLYGAGYDVTVQRRENVKWNQEKLDAVRKSMGNDAFCRVFTWEYKPKSAKDLAAFLSFGDEENCGMIRSACTVTKGASQFTYQPMGEQDA